MRDRPVDRGGRLYDLLVAKKRKQGDTAGRRRDEPPRQLDLSQFSSLDDALAKVEPGTRYLDVGKLLIPTSEDRPITMPLLFFMSMITRCEGLHGAIAREIRVGNPHAVFPLIRAFSEAVTLVIYVIDHVQYIDVLTARPAELSKSGAKRKSIQGLISYASKQAPGMKDVYAELSEATHFGAIAMWAAHTVEAEDAEGTFRTSWTSAPHWRSDEQAMIACAQTLELGDAMVYFLTAFASKHLAI
jgi:hypothetical protein